MANSSRSAKRCWRKRRRRKSRVGKGALAPCPRWREMFGRNGGHASLSPPYGWRALCDEFFVQPATAVVAPPNLSAHQPAGYAASRHDDPPQMPGGWFGSAPLQSKLADVDGCKSDCCHADPLGSSCPLQASPAAGSSVPLIGFAIVAPAATARNNTASSNPVLDPRDTRIIANRAATVVNEIRVLT